MKRILVVVVGLLAGALFHDAFAQRHEDGIGFDLVKEKDNISIYERWTQFPHSDPPIKAREVKGVFFVRTTIPKALALLKDEALIRKWQSHVSKFKVYPRTDTTWLEYSYHDIPWPVSDQDHFLRYRIARHDASSLFVIFESWEDKKLAPIHEDADRMELYGSWLFQQKGDKIKVTYSILSRPSNIPRIFTDPVIRNNMLSTIKSYIEILEKEKKKK